MPALQVSYQAFVNRVKMSRKPHILLEGTQDKRFFDSFSLTIAGREGGTEGTTSLPRPVITTAESIKSDIPGEGNRYKVEKASELVGSHSFGYRFVGFVDREFRKFALDDRVEDKLKTQRRQGRLVWSRGHSIENYLFDFDTVRTPLRVCTPDPEIAQNALGILRANFGEIINIACSLGLAARDLGQLESVRRTISWDITVLSGPDVQWDIEKWKLALKRDARLDSQTIDSLVQNFERWLGIVRTSNQADVKWACDAHTGYRLIWQGYASIVNHVCLTQQDTVGKASNQRSAILGVNDAIKFNQLVESWISEMSPSAVDTPALCFKMVGAAA